MRHRGRELWQLRDGRHLLGLILLACAPSQAELQAQAYAAADHASAVSTCARMTPAGADPCRVEAAERFGRLEPADCDAVQTEPWRSECGFQYAERLARAGRAEEAFVVCTSTRFSRECGYHLLREVARGVVDQDVGGAAAALEPWRTVPGVGDAPRLYWKAWFRERRRSERPADPTGCPDESCTVAARESYFEGLRALHHADRAGFCAGAPPPVPGWAATATTDEWARRWADDACARDAAEGVGASRSAGAPAIPPPE